MGLKLYLGKCVQNYFKTPKLVKFDVILLKFEVKADKLDLWTRPSLAELGERLHAAVHLLLGRLPAEELQDRHRQLSANVVEDLEGRQVKYGGSTTFFVSYWF